MVQRQVIVRDAGHQLLDELDATDIPALAYDASGTAATAASGAASALSTHAGAADPHPGYLTPAEGNAAYDATGAAAAAQAASWPATTAFDATAPTTAAFSDAAAAGSAAKAAHRDHLHGMPALGTTAAAIGTSAGGSATTPSKSDHVHATGAGTPSTQAFGDAAATGSGPAAAMTDHKHAMPTPTYNPGGTDVAVADGGTGASTAAAARINLGLPDIPWTVVTKPSDESVSSSTTPQNDDHLLFATVAAAVYEWEILLIYASPVGAATPDLKVMPGESGTYYGPVTGLGLSTSDTLNSTGLIANASQTQTYGTAAANRVMRMYGIYTAGGGTWNFAWSQNTSDANATTVRAGSVLRYRRLL